VTSAIMDVDYDEEDTEVAPVVFVPDVDETLTGPAVEFEVSFTHHRVPASHLTLGNRTTIPRRARS
jgi:hypothetical protein